MKYDFDTCIKRRSTWSTKWNVEKDELPMWIADMDFRTAPCVVRALETRAHHGVFGYSDVGSEWYEAYQHWWKSRHDFSIEREWMAFCTGVVPAISSVIRKLTTPAEKVVVMTPVYNIFFNSILNNGRQVLECPLRCDESGWNIDFDRLREALADPQTTMLILCNPHNPVGRIWTAEELKTLGTMCKEEHVTVISDEIHCDITDPGMHYVPFASVSDVCRDISVTCVSPAKCFNMAGLQTSAVIVPDEAIRNRVIRAINTDEAAEPNFFAQTATVVAFERGGEWLDEMNEYVYQNKICAEKVINDEIPELSVHHPQATYLLWIDCSAYGDSVRVADYIRKKTGLYLSPGSQYGTGGRFYLRMNVACPRAYVLDGLDRLKTALSLWRA